uniref:Uncharacterized protein n=1 Tax=Arundo donax TaxID=35708 RepID=A0A0A9GAI8_ARUDO
MLSITATAEACITVI